jgi:squalene synthase HpnD
MSGVGLALALSLGLRSRRQEGVEAADFRAVAARVRAAGTSFYQGMRILPPPRRAAMYAIYAFCREVDDIADEADTLERKRQGLTRWRERVGAFYRGEGDDPVTRILAWASRTYELRAADFLAIIDGMEMDAEGPIIAPPLATLLLYCDRVAGAVGRLAVRVFGDASASADRVAAALGEALQLTNILRDLAEDAARGRLYLPAEWLAAEGVPADPAAALTAPGLPRVTRRMAERAAERFAEAERWMAVCDRRAMRPARLMGATYHALLERLLQQGFADPARPVRLPAWQKFHIVLRHGLF